MIKVEHIGVFNMESAIRGMRNPLDSWEVSDSYAKWNDECAKYDFVIGEKDMELALKLTKAGSDHSKFLRQIFVSMDITAPLYWWKECDTYKVGTVANSESTMLTLHKTPITLDMFSIDFLDKKDEDNVMVIPKYKDKETWKDINGYEGYYQISSHGNIRSLDRHVKHSKGGHRLLKGKEIAKCINSSGYYKVMLNKKGTTKNEYIHRLVAQAFIENPEDKPETNHKDGNKLNNHISNLEWATIQENAQHAHDTGLSFVSGYTRYKVAKASARFTMDTAKKIRQEFADGERICDLAQKYDCYDSTIINIVYNKTYQDIELTYEDYWKIAVDHLEDLRRKFVETKDKKYWRQLIQLLPSSFNQMRTWTANYTTLRNIYHARKHHKLTEWRTFCDIIEQLPYSGLITCK